MRDRPKGWEMTAECYEKHSEPHGKAEPMQRTAHCGAIAENYMNAEDEADELAREHRAMRPHEMVQ